MAEDVKETEHASASEMLRRLAEEVQQAEEMFIRLLKVVDSKIRPTRMPKWREALLAAADVVEAAGELQSIMLKSIPGASLQRLREALSRLEEMGR